MRPLHPSYRRVLEALVECADGAATITWLCQFTDLTHTTVDRGLYELARRGLACWVGTTPRVAGRDGRRPNVYAATPRGRALVEPRHEAAA